MLKTIAEKQLLTFVVHDNFLQKFIVDQEGATRGVEKNVLKNFTVFTGKRLKACNFIKKRL